MDDAPAGEVLKPVYPGHVAKRFGVFSPARSDVWVMDETGEVYGAYQLHGEGTKSYWKMANGSTVHYPRNVETCEAVPFLRASPTAPRRSTAPFC